MSVDLFPHTIADAAVRWMREGTVGEWVLVGPAHLMKTGDTVEVFKARGGFEEVEVGEILATLPDGRVTARRQVGNPNRWFRLHGVWVVSGPNLEPGRIVEVKSSSGAMKRVRIGEIVSYGHGGDGLMLAMPETPVERPMAVKPEAWQTYAHQADGKRVRAYAAQHGGVYGKVWNEHTQRYEYVGAAFDGGVVPLNEQAS